MVAQWPGRLLDIPRIPQDSSGILAFPGSHGYSWHFLRIPVGNPEEMPGITRKEFLTFLHAGILTVILRLYARIRS